MHSLKVFLLAVIAVLSFAAVAQAEPTPRLTVSPTSPVAGSPVQFDASASGCARTPCTYRYRDLGPDNSTRSPNWMLRNYGSSPLLTYTFSGVGRKNVELTVRNRLGRTASIKRAVDVVAAPAPEPTPTPSPDPTPTPSPDPTPTPSPDPTPTPSPDPTPTPSPDPTPTPSPDCTTTATPATFASVVAGAPANAVVCLSAGSYGTFRGSLRSTPVTVKGAAGYGSTMSLDFNPATNYTFDGLRIPSADFADSRTRNITVRNADIPGQVTFRTGELANSNILFTNNVHRDFNACGGCGPEGRIWLPERTSQPSGITIANSEFVRGLSDGIQNGSNGTRIINNEFHAIPSGSAEGVHADAIQLYGSQNTVISGNWMHDLASGVGIIMGADGVDHEVIEDNVVGPNVSRPFLDISSDNGSIIRHNTLADGACEFNQRCGGVVLNNKSGDPVGQGTVIENNILRSISGSGQFTSRYNLLAGQNPIGEGDLRGLPTYVGPLTSKAGFKLAAGSLGKGNASDGLDRGARIP